MTLVKRSGPYGLYQTIHLDGAQCDIDTFREPGSVIITGLYTPAEHRGKGAATRLLRALRRWAKRNKRRLVLYVGAFRDKPMTNKQLRAFYEKVGFKVYNREYGTDWMELTP
ncbi:GNAT family N-acetyltransferase [Mesorhizobium sp. M0016]|uniref:GNAT family N-acetyltransferase n=1 Tax=Mesorhizobium sp. M0016 TaxID=2956843 RepID=UPI0033354797